MRYMLVLAVLVVALVVAGFGLTVAQDEQRTGGGELCGELLASPGASPVASPLASPVATLIASIVASPDASPVASPTGLIDCATPGVDATP